MFLNWKINLQLRYVLCLNLYHWWDDIILSSLVPPIPSHQRESISLAVGDGDGERSSVSVSSRVENKAENDLLKSQTDIGQVGLRLKPGLISFGLQPLRWVLACGVWRYTFFIKLYRYRPCPRCTFFWFDIGNGSLSILVWVLSDHTLHITTVWLRSALHAELPNRFLNTPGDCVV